MKQVIAFNSAKRRGRQRGHLFVLGKSYVGEWRVDVAVGPGLYEWRKKKKVLCPVTKGKRYAQDLLDEEIARTATVRDGPHSLITLSDFYEHKFIPMYVQVRLKLSGQQHYGTVWRTHIEPYLGHLPLRDVTFEKVQKLIAQEKTREHPSPVKPKDGNPVKMIKGYAPQTLLHVRNVLSAMFRMAKRMHLYSGDLPTEGVEIGEITHKARRALTPAQFVDLVNALTSPYKQLTYFLGVTGLRIGEACGLRWQYVNLTDEPVYVDDQSLPPMCLGVRWNWVRGRYGTVKKDASVRIVPIPKELAEMLREHKAQSQFAAADDPVFAGRQGAPLNHHNVAKRAFRKAAKTAGVPWASWHCLRHTSNTTAGATGMSIGARKRVYGWTVDRMALHYDHEDVEQTREGMERIEEVLTLKKKAGEE